MQVLFCWRRPYDLLIAGADDLHWSWLLKRWIKNYPPDKSLDQRINIRKTTLLSFPTDSDLSNGWRYSAFKQLGTELLETCGS